MLNQTPTIASTLTTAISSIASDVMDSIMAILPVALPIMGAVVIVTLGIKIFRKVSGR